jgi:hypothetical protein
MMVHCLFFSFVGQLGFGYSILAQEMSSVILYLPCFGEWLITCPLLAFLPFLCLFTVNLVLRPAPCSSPFLWCTFRVPAPFAIVLDYSLLFVIQFVGMISLPRGCAALSQGWMGEFHMVHSAHLFVLSNYMQAGLEPVVVEVAAVRNGSKFFQYNMARGRFPLGRGSGC